MTADSTDMAKDSALAKPAALSPLAATVPPAFSRGLQISTSTSTTAYDGLITATNAGTLSGQGTINYSGGLHQFNTLDGTTQFAIGTQTHSYNYWQAVGAQPTVPPTFLVSGIDTNISGSFAAKGTGGFNFGNGSGMLLQLVDIGTQIINIPTIKPGASNGSVIYGVSGGDGLPCNVALNANLNGTVALGNSDGPLGTFSDGNSFGTPVIAYFTAITAKTDGTPVTITVGNQVNAGIKMASRGTGTVYLGTGSGSLMQIIDPGSTVINALQLSGGLSNSALTLRAVAAPGDSLPCGVRLWALLNGSATLSNDNGPLATFTDANSSSTAALGYFVFTTQATAGTAPTISVTGSTNNSIKLLSKGTGTALVSAGGTGSVQLGISGDKIAFLGATAITKPSVSGSWAGNVAGQALAAALANLGLITNNTTA